MPLDNLRPDLFVASSATGVTHFAAVLVAVCLAGLVAGCSEETKKKKQQAVSEASRAETALMADAPRAIDELERRIRAKISFLNGHFIATDEFGVGGIYLFSEVPAWLLNCGPIGIELNIGTDGQNNRALRYHLSYRYFTKEDCLTITPGLAVRLEQWIKDGRVR